MKFSPASFGVNPEAIIKHIPEKLLIEEGIIFTPSGSFEYLANMTGSIAVFNWIEHAISIVVSKDAIMVFESQVCYTKCDPLPITKANCNVSGRKMSLSESSMLKIKEAYNGEPCLLLQEIEKNSDGTENLWKVIEM